MTHIRKKIFFSILILHGIVVNIIIAIVLLFIQNIISVYEFALVWFLSNQLNSLLFHLYDYLYPTEQILKVASKIGVISSLQIYKKLFSPVSQTNINGRLFFSITMHIAYFGFYLFLIISIINVFYEVYQISLKQNIIVYSISALMYYFILDFNKSLGVSNKKQVGS